MRGVTPEHQPYTCAAKTIISPEWGSDGDRLEVVLFFFCSPDSPTLATSAFRRLSGSK
jgi:hypothetical protein